MTNCTPIYEIGFDWSLVGVQLEFSWNSVGVELENSWRNCSDRSQVHALSGKTT